MNVIGKPDEPRPGELPPQPGSHPEIVASQNLTLKEAAPSEEVPKMAYLDEGKAHVVELARTAGYPHELATLAM
jgi:hypothetical protein